MNKCGNQNVVGIWSEPIPLCWTCKHQKFDSSFHPDYKRKIAVAYLCAKYDYERCVDVEFIKCKRLSWESKNSHLTPENKFKVPNYNVKRKSWIKRLLKLISKINNILSMW